jgi:hypothetical protein
VGELRFPAIALIWEEEGKRAGDQEILIPGSRVVTHDKEQLMRRGIDMKVTNGISP